MATRLLAPSMGEGVEELTIVNWLKNEGDTVKELEVIVEVETEKVTTEIPSPASGTLLKIVAAKDSKVKVGSTMAWIGKPGEAIESGASTEKKPAPAKEPIAPPPAEMKEPQVKEVLPPMETNKQPVAETVRSSTSVKILSPLVKNLLAANSIDANLVEGTGLNGRITREDVEKYLETRRTAPAPAGKPVPPISTDTSSVGQLIPHTSIRRQIAERMVRSKTTSPHVLTVMEADMSRVVAHHAANKAPFAQNGINLTLTAYFCSAIVTALRSNPEVNSSWLEEGIQRYRNINLGIATSLGDEGLIVPVIKNAEQLSFEGLAQKINDLSTRARSKKLMPEEVRGGTFTLTNHGSGKSLFAMPIIFQPQAAILGTGRMEKRVVVVTDVNGNDSIAIRPMVYLSLVFDHRILDGEGADRFLQRVKETLENWE
jgi:2-oxoglutarate dehydrogenase E2 component (dihydrolipoamide succinyltransferase)